MADSSRRRSESDRTSSMPRPSSPKSDGENTGRSSPPPVPTKTKQSVQIKSVRPTISSSQQVPWKWPVLGGVGLCVCGGLIAFLMSARSAPPVQKSNSVENHASTPSVDNVDLSASDAGNEVRHSEADEMALAETPNSSREGNKQPTNAASETSDLERLANDTDFETVSVSEQQTDPEATEVAVADEAPRNADEEAEWTPKESVANEPVESDLKNSATNVDELIEKGIRLLKENLRKEAITSLKRASHLAQTQPRADFYLGLIYLGSGSKEPKDAREKIESAELHFNRAFNRTADKTPERVAAANNLALVELKLRKIPAARNYFGIAAKQNPRPPEVNHNVGRLLSQIRIFDVKADELKRINALNADPNDIRSQTGWIYLPLDLTDRTRSDCEAICPRGTLEDISCTMCNGCTQLLCKTCGGRGKKGALGSVAERREVGFGTSVTLSAQTTNMIQCSECNGDGRIDCHVCQDGRDPNLRH